MDSRTQLVKTNSRKSSGHLCLEHVEVLTLLHRVSKRRLPLQLGISQRLRFLRLWESPSEHRKRFANVPSQIQKKGTSNATLAASREVRTHHKWIAEPNVRKSRLIEHRDADVVHEPKQQPRRGDQNSRVSLGWAPIVHVHRACCSHR